MNNNQNIQQELSCPVCMCLFKNPITIQCGHTLCSLCLINHTVSKQFCPICRTVLSYIPEHPHQDQVLSNIVEYIRNNESNNSLKKQPKNKQIQIDHLQHLFLLDIHCTDILLPYTKVIATFELQSLGLLEQLQRFVARQSAPYNKYGVVSKIRNINQLSFNIYSGQIEGKSFCEISEQQIKNKNNQHEQCCYRQCQAKIIYDQNQIEQSLLDRYRQILKRITNQEILQKISKLINIDNIYSNSNVMACYYSIVKIISESCQKKYQAVVSFDQQIQQQLLTSFINNVKYDVEKQPWKFVSVKPNSQVWNHVAKVLAFFFAFVFLEIFIF